MLGYSAAFFRAGSIRRTTPRRSRFSPGSRTISIRRLLWRLPLCLCGIEAIPATSGHSCDNRRDAPHLSYTAAPSIGEAAVFAQPASGNSFAGVRATVMDYGYSGHYPGQVHCFPVAQHGGRWYALDDRHSFHTRSEIPTALAAPLSVCASFVKSRRPWFFFVLPLRHSRASRRIERRSCSRYCWGMLHLENCEEFLGIVFSNLDTLPAVVFLSCWPTPSVVTRPFLLPCAGRVLLAGPAVSFQLPHNGAQPVCGLIVTGDDTAETCGLYALGNSGGRWFPSLVLNRGQRPPIGPLFAPHPLTCQF